MAFNYISQEPPLMESRDGRVLAEWLGRELRNVVSAVKQRLDLDTERELDVKPIDGMLRYIEAGPEGPGFYGRVNGVWVRFGISGDVLIGYYNVTTQLVEGGVYDGLALPVASAVEDRQYMIVLNTGTLITPNAPEINGTVVGTGDIIRSYDDLWYVEAISGDYLSSVVDDTANGNITLAKTPTDPNHAARKAQVDAVQTNLTTHIGHGPEVNVHGSKTYTDQEIQALAAAVIENFVSTAYGGLILNSATIGVDIPTTGFITIPFLSGSVTTPRDVIQEPSTDSIIINEEGIYCINVSFSFDHNDSQQGREIEFALFNMTTGITDGEVIVIGIGRNQIATSFSWSFLAEIGVAEVGHRFRLELGNASQTITNVVWNACDWSVFHISEYKGQLTP